MFPYCPAWVLSWHYRKQVLLMELRRYNADILCLQVGITAFSSLSSRLRLLRWFLRRRHAPLEEAVHAAQL